MGLDIVLYDEKGYKINILEFSSKLHDAIFGTNYWGCYKGLRKIKDYYRTNETFIVDDLNVFIENLLHFRENISSEFSGEITFLVNELRDKKVYKIHIAGD